MVGNDLARFLHCQHYTRLAVSSRLFFCFLLLISFPLLAEKIDRFTLGGVSAYQEDAHSLVGTGAGFGFGADVQINKHFGIEHIVVKAPALDEDAFVEVLAGVIGSRIFNCDLEKRANFYVSILGTVSVPFKENTSWIAKIDEDLTSSRSQKFASSSSKSTRKIHPIGRNSLNIVPIYVDSCIHINKLAIQTAKIKNCKNSFDSSVGQLWTVETVSRGGERHLEFIPGRFPRNRPNP